MRAGPGFLKARIGATGETLYDITEGYIISKWHLFSDEFRARYRAEIYED